MPATSQLDGPAGPDDGEHVTEAEAQALRPGPGQDHGATRVQGRQGRGRGRRP